MLSSDNSFEFKTDAEKLGSSKVETIQSSNCNLGRVKVYMKLVSHGVSVEHRIIYAEYMIAIEMFDSLSHLAGQHATTYVVYPLTNPERMDGWVDRESATRMNL
ncbi:hypothetical protein HELRODRAFT_179008 [Helobdella robusta]|uniref:Uncharacterized protein n=1 Tax=Helobdella robusta TaxID=6412 RepID=T1FE17_HELRO|nr:hypothetical protein HELRODRAFT_179008 [Helobdella robusta]ESN95822.1 hypothetical protein HELRODRAFT_179008 [Helobdella robusta]